MHCRLSSCHARSLGTTQILGRGGLEAEMTALQLSRHCVPVVKEQNMRRCFFGAVFVHVIPNPNAINNPS